MWAEERAWRKAPEHCRRRKWYSTHSSSVIYAVEYSNKVGAVVGIVHKSVPYVSLRPWTSPWTPQVFMTAGLGGETKAKLLCLVLWVAVGNKEEAGHWSLLILYVLNLSPLLSISWWPYSPSHRTPGFHEAKFENHRPEQWGTSIF